MINNKYTKAYKEVLEIIKYFPEKEYNRIPKEKIDYYKNNMDINYAFTINPNKDLSEQNISKEAKAIIVLLYQDYFATEEQKQKIKEILELNQKKIEMEKRKRYNPDNLLKKENEHVRVETKPEEMALVSYKENFFVKFKNFVIKLFHLR